MQIEFSCAFKDLNQIVIVLTATLICNCHHVLFFPDEIGFVCQNHYYYYYYYYYLMHHT